MCVTVGMDMADQEEVGALLVTDYCTNGPDSVMGTMGWCSASGMHHEHRKAVWQRRKG